MIESCFSKDELAVLEQAIDTYGWEAQTDMMIEEMSELTKALLKFRRAGDNEDMRTLSLISICEEMADVEIMLAQMHLIYGESDRTIRYKLDRLEQRIKEARK